MISTKYTDALLLRRAITLSETCSKKLSSPFSGGAIYHGGLPNALFLKGSSGDYNNMNMDCDGANNSAGRWPNLGRSGDTNGFTSAGEVFLALDELCFRKDTLPGDNGHDPKDDLNIGWCKLKGQEHDPIRGQHQAPGQSTSCQF
ncbi:hypothetical protein MKX08_005797, partial [Trichoderma sp. CBMAI-0020]